LEKAHKIVHVGAGYWGKNIVRNLAEMGVLSHICDGSTETIARFRQIYPNISFSSDIDEPLSDESVSAFSIATPAATHFDLVKKCLIAGKDVFVEKPLALQYDEGKELARLAAEKQCILMVGHILLYHPAILKMKQLMDDGVLGKIGYCYSNRLNLGKVRKEENILWSFAPHDISVLNFLMNGPPDTVYASGEIILQPGIHDVTLTALKWKVGISAHINVSWLHPFKEHRFVVVGDKAMLVFDDTRTTDKLVLYDRGIDFVSGEPVKRDKETRTIEFAVKEPLRAELEHFLECLTDRKKPKSDATEALAVLRVLTEAQTSLT